MLFILAQGRLGGIAPTVEVTGMDALEFAPSYALLTTRKAPTLLLPALPCSTVFPHRVGSWGRIDVVT